MKRFLVLVLLALLCVAGTAQAAQMRSVYEGVFEVAEPAINVYQQLNGSVVQDVLPRGAQLTVTQDMRTGNWVAVSYTRPGTSIKATGYATLDGLTKIASLVQLAAGDGYENNGRDTPVYAQPVAAGEPVDTLVLGLPVRILAMDGDWLQVQYTPLNQTAARTGWAKRSAIGKTPAYDVPITTNPPPPSGQQVRPTQAPGAVYPVPSAQPVNAKTAIVNNPNPADRLNLRKKPSAVADTLGKYYNGVEVAILADAGNGWAQVSIGGRTGYMMTRYLSMGGKPGDVKSAMPVLTVKNPKPTDWLNLRATPSTAGKVLGKYYNGQRVTVLGVCGTWYHVSVDGIMGFMLTQYVK